MHKYFVLFFSVSVFLSACGGGTAADNILDKKQMVALLTDVHIVDGRMYALGQNPDSLYKYGTAKYLAVFKKHHTDSAQFKNSLKFYSAKPADLLIIYDQVMKILQVKTDSLNKVQRTRKNSI